MTLRDKFDKISCKDCDMPYCDTKCVILSDRQLKFLERTADDYAVYFHNWTMSKTWNDKNCWSLPTTELLEMFKKEKGL